MGKSVPSPALMFFNFYVWFLKLCVFFNDHSFTYPVFRFADFQGYVQKMYYVHLKIEVKVEGPVFFLFRIVNLY
jgi:hypothetical protein